MARCSAASWGRSAWKWNGAGEHAITVRKPPPEGLTVLASRHYAADERLKAYLAGHKVASITNFGSALKICRVAEGGRRSLSPPWPHDGMGHRRPAGGAGSRGGRLLDLNGNRLTYGKPLWENPHFVCLGG